MKYNITFPKKIRIGLIVISALLWASCTENFEERNTNPSGLETLNPEDVKSLFPNALYRGWNQGSYQTGQNLTADMYCQFFAGTQPAFASHRYVINQMWMQSFWTGTYVSTLPSLFTIINETSGGDLPTLNAIARIWRVFIMNRITDYFGPIPYSQIGSAEREIPYDDQKDIYYDFFKELEEATTDLKNNLETTRNG